MSEPGETERRGRRVSGFDVRLIIAVLIGVYGIVLTIMGAAVTTRAELDRADGMNINLWAGIAMIVVALLFVLWARLRPLVLPTKEQEEESRID